MQGVVFKTSTMIFILCLALISSNTLSEAPNKKYMKLINDFNNCITVKAGKVGEESYLSRRTTMKCVRLTRELLFKVLEDNSYPPIEEADRSILFSYVEETCDKIGKSLGLIKSDRNFLRALDATASCLLFSKMEWKLIL